MSDPSWATQEIENSDTVSSPISPLTVAPLEEQDPLEARRAWSKVASAIEMGQMSAVANGKSNIEVRQREMPKKEQAEGREWSRRYFKKVQQHPLLKSSQQE